MRHGRPPGLPVGVITPVSGDDDQPIRPVDFIHREMRIGVAAAYTRMAAEGVLQNPAGRNLDGLTQAAREAWRPHADPVSPDALLEDDPVRAITVQERDRFPGRVLNREADAPVERTFGPLQRVLLLAGGHHRSIYRSREQIGIGDVALTGGDVLVEGLTFPMASDVLDVPAGSYDLEVRLSGTEDVVLPLPGTELTANTFYQVYAIGSAESGEIAPFVIATEIMSADSSMMMSAEGCASILGIGMDSDACVNVIHASPDAPNVDVWVNGEPALTNVAFQEFSGWLALPAGEYHVVVTPTGESADAAVIDAMLMLDAGVAYHVAAVGPVADIQPAVIEADLSATTDGNARVRVIHASPDAPAVDIALTDGDVLIPNLEFGAASDYLEVPAGSYDLEVRVAGTTDVALPLAGTAFEGNMLYDVIAVGTVADGTLTVLVIPSMTSHGN